MASSSCMLCFAVLTSFIVLPSLLADSSSSSNLTDREALLMLKSSIPTDPTKALASWNGTSDVCRWRGVLCNGQNRVAKLDLSGLGLTGSLPPHTGNLSHLQFLFLQENQFSGELPPQLGDLLWLEVLNASSNLISGAITPNLSNCLNLTSLDLSSNVFSGRIPAELGLLTRLQFLKLGKNQLTGAIPAAIGNLSSLNTFDVATNALNGEIPRELGRLREIQFLDISINNLTGEVPPSLYNLSSLVKFAFAMNDLVGEIPVDIGRRLPNLLILNFCFNQFTGLIPASIHNLTKIRTLRFSYNYLHGKVPPGLENLRDLTMYTIAGNRIVSYGDNGLDFLTSLTNSTKIEYLAIDGNLLEGVVPDSVGNLSKTLTRFMLGGNRIYGRIPASVGQLSSLNLLNMSHNLLSGEIPPEIGQLKQLKVLGLGYNKLSGEIPAAAIGGLATLTKLELQGNQLVGGIPSSFGNLQQLISLDVSDNHLQGYIPKQLFALSSLSSLLNLSYNALTGSLPAEISNLENIISVDVSSNLLSGSIPDSIGNCGSLQNLSLSNNSFTGQIPNSIGELKALQSLDLSSNQLTGSIPESIGELHALEFLNLSFNHLQGEVPNVGVFRNPAAIHLEGNSGLCAPSSCKNTTSHSSQLHYLIVVAAASTLLLLVSVVWIFATIRRRNAIEVLPTTKEKNSVKGQHPIISYDELQVATKSFDPANLIGTGSFGSVYKGVLRDGEKVAVKVLNLEVGGAIKSFIAECESLRNARHRNLVKLITLCLSLDSKHNDFRALVYEFMGNGSLEEWIRGKRRHHDGKGLNLVERLDAAIDVASALDYLHNDCEVQVVHCDLKPSNVVLDADMTAKVADFGLARVVSEGTLDSTATFGLKGSIGYIPPEYGFGGRPSTRGDVYSYGVMLLELLTGKSPTSEFFAGNLSLEKWVRSAFPVELANVVDGELMAADVLSYGGRPISAEKQDECLVAMIDVGLSCARELPDARLAIRDALCQLKKIRDELMKPHVAIAV